MPNENDRILTLELNFKNFMENVEAKFNTILKKLDEMPTTYTNKVEFWVLCEKVKNIEKQKIARVKNWGMIIVALISSTVTVITLLAK